jgi:hypothetical protein
MTSMIIGLCGECVCIPRAAQYNGQFPAESKALIDIPVDIKSFKKATLP